MIIKVGEKIVVFLSDGTIHLFWSAALFAMAIVGGLVFVRLMIAGMRDDGPLDPEFDEET